MDGVLLIFCVCWAMVVEVGVCACSGWLALMGGVSRRAMAFLAGRSALRADAGYSPRQATYLFAARQKARGKNVPYIQRPRKLRVANLSGQPALEANAGVRWNSLRARALRSNSHRKSEHEVWLSCGSQTAAVYSERRRWLKGVGQPTAKQPNSQTADQRQAKVGWSKWATRVARPSRQSSRNW